jgi:hypothetical protein
MSDLVGEVGLAHGARQDNAAGRQRQQALRGLAPEGVGESFCYTTS